jgi:hypothetical protein
MSVFIITFRIPEAEIEPRLHPALEKNLVRIKAFEKSNIIADKSVEKIETHLAHNAHV